MNDMKQEIGVGMAISGGGFRATLFHLGSFWRLNEIGFLPKLTRICSVSGGSIIAGLLGINWKLLNFNQEGIATNFKEIIVAPICNFCSIDIDVPSILGGWLSLLRSPGEMLEGKYNKHLYKNATLRNLPDDIKGEGPRFIIYATNLQTGVSVRFSKPFIGDYRLGLLDNPDKLIATAVAASSAFPPVLTPIIMKTDPQKWRHVEGADLYEDVSLRREMYLSDGGVYDNLGLEAVWNRYQTVLVSDAGAPFGVEMKAWPLKISQLKKMLRVLDITIEQTRALRKRKLIGDFKNKVRSGTYWGIATDIDDYKVSNPMVHDNDLTKTMKKIRTRLNSFSKKEQGHLINWGYALTDAAMRRHVISTPVPEGKWPVPDYALQS